MESISNVVLCKTISTGALVIFCWLSIILELAVRPCSVPSHSGHMTRSITILPFVYRIPKLVSLKEVTHIPWLEYKSARG